MSLFNELKRRNVFRVGLAYLISAWVIAQVAELILDSIEAPPWVMQTILMLLGLGFIIALIISWAYEITPEGIKKEKDVVRDESITNMTAKKLDYITIAGVLLVVVLFAYQQLNPASSVEKITVGPLSETAVEVAAVESQPVVEISNKSIAVLPFTNMANDPNNEPFTLGLHDDLLTHLSKISALKVISRTSVMEYKDTTKKIKDIAQELGVANILEGGVQRSGNQIRLNVQLIDAATDEHLWAEIYDRELTAANIFSIQTEVSKAIAAALKAQLTTAENQSIAMVPTDNLDAYNDYLAGRQLLAKRDSESLKQARILFQQAAALDPNYAQAYVGEASALRLLTEYSDLSYDEMFALGEPLIAQALALDPLLADGHTIKAAYLDEAGNYEEAERTYLYALSLNPNNAEAYHWYGHMLRIDLGRTEKALAIHRKAAELDPLSDVILANVGWSLRANGELQAALKQFQLGHQKSPIYPGALNGLAWVNDDLGNYTDAIRYQQLAVEIDPGNIRNRNWLQLHYLNIGDVESVYAELEKAKAISPQHYSYPYMESMLDVIQGDYVAAQQRFTDLLENNPENKFIINNLARFSVFNQDCAVVIKRLTELIPEFTEKRFQGVENNLMDLVELAWCLQQSGQQLSVNGLLQQAQQYLTDNPNNNDSNYFIQAAILAVQDQPIEAAAVYASLVDRKKTKRWYLVDHSPYYVDMRKQPDYIKARALLMQDLANQRAMLAEYRATGVMP
jgi:TolB-like protein/Tfp pilus assembly protein PilF